MEKDLGLGQRVLADTSRSFLVLLATCLAEAIHDSGPTLNAMWTASQSYSVVLRFSRH